MSACCKGNVDSYWNVRGLVRVFDKASYNRPSTFPQTNHYLASPGIHQTLGLLTFQSFFSAQGILITTAAQSTESQSIASLLAISCIIMHNTCMCMMSMYTTANSYGKQKHAVYTNNYVNTVSNTNKVHNIRYTTHTTVYQPFVGD